MFAGILVKGFSWFTLSELSHYLHHRSEENTIFLGTGVQTSELQVQFSYPIATQRVISECLVRVATELTTPVLRTPDLRLDTTPRSEISKRYEQIELLAELLE